MKTLKSVSTLFGMALLLMSLTGCGDLFRHQKPNFIYMPDMVYQPSFKAQKGQMRVPPKGTIPRDFTPFPTAYAYDPERSGKELVNPLPPSREVLMRGQQIFNTTCIVCHGEYGEGDGTVEAHGFPRPPSLQSDKIRNYPDGRIYNIISVGQNIMPSYALQIQQKDRWAVIWYLRALQRAKHPTEADLKAAQAASE